MRRGLFVFLFLAVAFGLAWQWREQTNGKWQRIAPDLELRVIKVRTNNIWSGGEAEVIALRTLPSRIRVVRGDLLEASAWRSKTKARAIINGGYFDEKDKPLGLRIQDNKQFGHLHGANWGVFYIRRGKAAVMHTRDFKRRFTSYKLITQAVQCGPRLVVNGRTTDLKKQTARRTGIGVQRDGRVIVAVSDGPLSFQQWANLWATSGGLNCRDALNLDGGGSTQISLKTKNKSLGITGSWPVPDVITIQ